MQRLKISALLTVLILICSGCNSPFNENILYTVRDIVDGDTIILTNGEYVRYIGIDTPESRKKIGSSWIWSPQPYAEAASELNKVMVMGKQVRLEFDRQKRDRYDRLLAYVYFKDRRTKQEKMVNEEMLRHGLATVYTFKPNTKYLNRFLSAQRKAKKNKKGIWSKK